MIGPICSERTIGPRAQSLRMGSHETETKKPMSSNDNIYDEAVAPLISLGVPSGFDCINNFFRQSMPGNYKAAKTLSKKKQLHLEGSTFKTFQLITSDLKGQMISYLNWNQIVKHVQQEIQPI